MPAKPKLIQYTRTQRLTHMIAGWRKNDTVLPVLMHAFDRYAAGVQPESDLDKAVQRALSKSTRFTPQAMQALVQSWKEVPAPVKEAAVAPHLRNLQRTDRFDAAWFANETGENLFINAIPVIKEIVTSEGKHNDMPKVTAGEAFTISALRVPAAPDKISVAFYTHTGGGEQVLKTVQPTSATASGDVVKIKVTAPALAGDVLVRVLTGKSRSPGAWLHIAPKPGTFVFKLDTKITGMTPAAQYPGKKAVLKGTGFTGAMHVHLQADDGTKFHFGPSVIKFKSLTEMEFTIPQSVPPGNYKIALGGNSKLLSSWFKFTVRSPNYRLKYTKLHCLDESNPESNSDDIVTASVVLSDPNFRWTWTTGEYNDMGDGVWRDYLPKDAWIFPKTSDGAKWQPVRDYLSVTTMLYEWDSGSIDGLVSALSEVGNAASEIAAAFGPIGGIVSIAISGLNGLLSMVLPMFFSGPDFLGTWELSWTAPELQKLTAGKKTVSDRMWFLNDSDDGSYEVDYTIYRDEPA